MSDWMDNPKQSLSRLKTVQAIAFAAMKLPSEWTVKRNDQMVKANFNPLDCYLYYTSEAGVAGELLSRLQKDIEVLQQVINQDGK